MSAHKTTALVTGASAGLGWEFCRQLAERCEVIIAVARRADALADLATELAGQAEVHCIEADLASPLGVARAMEALRQKGPVDFLGVHLLQCDLSVELFLLLQFFQIHSSLGWWSHQQCWQSHQFDK